MRVVHGGQVLAESDRALVLRETGCPERYYIPAEDVRLDLLTPSGTQTYCPFKGTASYWSLPEAADLVWAYPDPSRTSRRSRTTCASTRWKCSDD